MIHQRCLAHAYIKHKCHIGIVKYESDPSTEASLFVAVHDIRARFPVSM
jgi:hypothetical protein